MLRKRSSARSKARRGSSTIHFLVNLGMYPAVLSFSRLFTFRPCWGLPSCAHIAANLSGVFSSVTRYKPPSAVQAAAAAADKAPVVTATPGAARPDGKQSGSGSGGDGGGGGNGDKSGGKLSKAGRKAAAAAKGKSKPAAATADVTVDASLLDLRVGLIVEAKNHPESDKLYIEEIECGAPEGRLTVLSGLNGKVPLESMQNRPVVLLMNLKPAKMGGIMSNAMVMCASEDTVEPVEPPAGAVPGDKITFPGISGPGKDPATANAMKKKKYLEKILPDLKTDGSMVACYKGVPFTVEGKGVCTVKSMKNAHIK